MTENTTTQHDQYYEMANAPVNRIIPKLAVPTIISMLVTSIYNMADTFFVSQLGTSASGAIGIVFSAMAIIQALSFMVGMGSGNFIARSIGAGKRELADNKKSTRRSHKTCFLCQIYGFNVCYFLLSYCAISGRRYCI